MPPRTRRERPPTQQPTTAAIDGIENSIQKAHDLVASTDPATLQRLWRELCQTYRDAVRIGLTNETFPYWILHNIPDQAIQQMIYEVYGEGARKIKSYCPALCKRFGVPQWQFVLFLGRLPQNRVVDLNNVTKDRRGITFDDLYRELCRIRSKKEPLPNGPCEFTPKEIKSCFQDLDEHEGSTDDDYHDDEETSDDISRVDISSDDDPLSEYNDDHWDILFDSPVNDNSPPDSSSSITDTQVEQVASPTNAASSISVVIQGARAPATQKRDMDDPVSLLGQQVDQSGGRQVVSSEVSGVSRLLESEPTADTIVVSDDTAVLGQGQTSRTTNITCQRLIDLRSTVDSLWTMNEQLKQDQEEILREKAEIWKDRTAEVQSLKLLLDSESTAEVDEVGKAKWSRVVALDRKHAIVEDRFQEYRAKRLKYDNHVEELSMNGLRSIREDLLAGD